MWHTTSEHMKRKYNVKYTPQNFENCWRVLERNYKRYVENNSSTGRGRKYFEFELNPEILLTTSGEIRPNNENEAHDMELIENQETPTKALGISAAKVKQQKVIKYKKENILKQIQLDRKQYQEERLKLEKY
ncbi:unnamed protein product [Acanthoscelides obtectus]|uniref:Uncharacterized protein n=1 Tax=Acanthoscelides obtectus TaxID=200917 RepID=A0A9P0KZS8_ACAOB|nr:unnamed protein product [Acanthoscelides obtectus]CAK1622196.1 hypothetical protein AOBTE_LOCUS1364 [Acanthoscelides obtectus]